MSTLIIVVTQRLYFAFVKSRRIRVNSYHSCYATCFWYRETFSLRGSTLIIVVTQHASPNAVYSARVRVNSYHSCYATGLSNPISPWC